MAKYNIGNIERLDQSLVKNGIDSNIRNKIMKYKMGNVSLFSSP
jgi:hypothetical protein